jgi:hypothetical protein
MELKKSRQTLKDENNKHANNLRRLENDFSSVNSSKQSTKERLEKKLEHLKAGIKRKDTDIQQVNKLVTKNASAKEIVAEKEKQIKNIKENHKIDLEQLKAEKKILDQKVENLKASNNKELRKFQSELSEESEEIKLKMKEIDKEKKENKLETKQ